MLPPLVSVVSGLPSVWICVWGNTLTGKKGEAATELSSPSYFGSLYDIFRVGFENIESVFKIALLQ